MRGVWWKAVKEGLIAAVIAFVIVAAVQALSLPAVASISQPLIWIAGMAGSLGMALYLLRSHPRIRGAQPW